ncbi:Exosome complex component CSL4 [Trinorchestia longiramus]|nr:Exosome complex component CSL4 [Trinorchestia longiramus]
MSTATLPAKSSSLCIPGDRLCPAGTHSHAAEGTYLFNGYIYASRVGRVSTTQHNDQTLVKVTGLSGQTAIPEVGSLVTARVLTIHSQMIKVAILAVEDDVLNTPFRGMVRKINVREHLVDKVEMYECFRPDDIILARVLSLGDALSYELSTSLPELGVVTARCEEGHLMVPVSWTSMKCQCRTENRKVAKVVPPNNT